MGLTTWQRVPSMIGMKLLKQQPPLVAAGLAIPLPGLVAAMRGLCKQIGCQWFIYPNSPDIYRGNPNYQINNIGYQSGESLKQAGGGGQPQGKTTNKQFVIIVLILRIIVQCHAKNIMNYFDLTKRD